MTAKCVKCQEEATKGSYQEPYCLDCFKKVWGNDNEKFHKHLDERKDLR